jgi:ATP-binding cassette subfamily C protein
MTSAPRGAALRQYLLALFGYMRWRAAAVFALLLAVGLTEGIGLLALIPLLHVLGLTSGDGADSPVAAATVRAFAAVGLPLTLPSLLGAFLALIVLRAVLMRARDLLLTGIRLGFVDHLRTRLYAAIGGADWLFLARTRTSDFTHVLTSDISRVAQGTDAVLRLTVSGCLAVVQVAIALSLSTIGTVAALSSGALLSLVLRPQLRRAHRLGHELTAASRDLFGNVTDFLGGLKLAKSYLAEDRHNALFEQSVTSMRRQLLDFARTGANARTVYQIGGAIALCGLLYLAVAAIRLPAVELLVLILIFARLMPTVSGMQQHWQALLHMLPAFEGAMAMQQRCEAAEEEHPPAAGTGAAPSLRLEREIRLRNVEFRYDRDADQDVLAGVDFVIPAQRTTALVGPSGAGKSTLADLLMGLLEAEAGVIEIDGLPLTRKSLRSWRGSVAYVPQETFLFHDTIRANLLWARPEANDDELWRVLDAAAAAEFVGAMPQGLDTVVGERGTRVSGGERQRLALARALLRRPSLLILDEATSALDSESERRVQASIEALHGRLTMIVIAHRLSTIRAADQIVVLDGGRVAEVGTWNELVARPDSRLSALLRAATSGVLPSSSGQRRSAVAA